MELEVFIGRTGSRALASGFSDVFISLISSTNTSFIRLPKLALPPLPLEVLVALVLRDIEWHHQYS